MPQKTRSETARHISAFQDSPRVPERPQRIRVATWNKYEVDGSLLRRQWEGYFPKAAVWACMIAHQAVGLYLRSSHLIPDRAFAALASLAAALLVILSAALLKRKTWPPKTKSPLATMRIHLDAGGSAYGIDTGNISFEDGWLMFEGHRCSFALCPGDVVATNRKGQIYAIDLASETAFVSVTFSFLQHNRKSLAAFEQAVDAWRKTKGAVSGISLYPPLSPGPEFAGKSKGFGKKLAGFIIAAWAGQCYLSALMGFFTAWLVSLFLSTLFWLAWNVGYLPDRKRALRELEAFAASLDPDAGVLSPEG